VEKSRCCPGNTQAQARAAMVRRRQAEKEKKGIGKPKVSHRKEKERQAQVSRKQVYVLLPTREQPPGSRPGLLGEGGEPEKREGGASNQKKKLGGAERGNRAHPDRSEAEHGLWAGDLSERTIGRKKVSNKERRKSKIAQ